MKIKSGFMLRTVAGCRVVVPVDARALDFNGMINLNETGAFLWELLEQGSTEDAMTAALLERYTDAEETDAREGVRDFVKVLREAEILDD